MFEHFYRRDEDEDEDEDEEEEQQVTQVMMMMMMMMKRCVQVGLQNNIRISAAFSDLSTQTWPSHWYVWKTQQEVNLFTIKAFSHRSRPLSNQNVTPSHLVKSTFRLNGTEVHIVDPVSFKTEGSGDLQI